MKPTSSMIVRQKSTIKRKITVLAFFLPMAILVASPCAQAANFAVNCDKKETISKALQLATKTNPQGPNRITVSGSCDENLLIQSTDRLTLVTHNGASITDSSGGSLAVVDIEDSQRVTLQGFTINGGVHGILCNTASLCYLTGNTIQGPGKFGVNVVKGSRAFLESNMIQNWGRGAFITGAQVFSSNDTFQGNGGSGIAVLVGAYFESLNSTFVNNGDGIEAGGSLWLNGGMISNNSSIGVRMLGTADVAFLGPTITGNGGVGVHLEDGAFAGFLAASITGNLGGLDIECTPQFPITRFIDRTGGVTNCVESVSNSKLRTVE